MHRGRQSSKGLFPLLPLDGWCLPSTARSMMVGRVILVLTGACRFGHGVGGFTTTFIHSGLSTPRPAGARPGTRTSGGARDASATREVANASGPCTGRCPLPPPLCGRPIASQTPTEGFSLATRSSSRRTRDAHARTSHRRRRTAAGRVSDHKNAQFTIITSHRRRLNRTPQHCDHKPPKEEATPKEKLSQHGCRIDPFGHLHAAVEGVLRFTTITSAALLAQVERSSAV